MYKDVTLKQPHKLSPFQYFRFAVLAVILLLIVFGYQLAKIYTDWKWFKELNQPAVYSTMISARLQLFFGFGLLFLLIIGFNLWFSRKLSAPKNVTRKLIDDDREKLAAAAQKLTHFGLYAGALIVAIAMGAQAAGQTNQFLLFTHAGTFGTADPIFQRDIGFYVFRLPFLMFLQEWLLFAAFASFVAAAVVHGGQRAVEMAAGTVPTLHFSARNHLVGIGAVIAIIFAWGQSLARYGYLNADNGPFFGAGYTDLHVRIPMHNISAFMLVLVAGLAIFSIVNGNKTSSLSAIRLPMIGLGVWASIFFLGNGIYAGFVQRFQVVPNQFDMEKSYIEHDIRYTQLAYGLDKIKTKDLSGPQTIVASDIKDNQPTIQNVRLWDWPQLGSVYNNRQAVRPYYRFQEPGASGNSNIDVDRYRFGDEYRQVMLGAREFYGAGLPATAQTWQNKRLQYTHGYGTVMSPVNEADAQGLPSYYMSQIPLQTKRKELEVKQPQIYFGEMTSEYAFVDTKQKEFDYPAGEGNQETTYKGKGGIALGSSIDRLLWSTRLGDTNMLLSGDLQSGSKILFRRNIVDRVKSVAPFITLDNDPYLVINDGKQVWMLDGYTVSDQYPYSKPSFDRTDRSGEGGAFNYIRNSVKAVVDSYDGSVDLYVSDDKDPIIKTWQRIFPTLMKPMSQLPKGLKEHLRYPEDMFRVQREVYSLYHITDARSYYGKEDAWDVPAEPTTTAVDGAAGAESMEPYYLNMRLPDGQDEEFILITPFTPRSRDNMSAWMCGRCDGDNYGQLIVYKFPKGSNINGPRQIMGLVKKNEDISKFQTLLGQQGSKVIYGNLLVIPMNSGLLYALPVYVQANDTNSLPGMSQVIVATGDRVAMKPTLNGAIAELFGAEAVSGSVEQTPVEQIDKNGGAKPTIKPESNAASKDPLVRLNSAYQKARQKQTEYDKSLDDLGKIITEMQGAKKTK